MVRSKKRRRCLAAFGRTAKRLFGIKRPAGTKRPAANRLAAAKRLWAAAGICAVTALVCRASLEGLPADYVEQKPWHLIRAEAVADGIRVETAGENLVLHRGVRVRADSEENRDFSAANIRDGICDEENLRWSSANDWENNEHWLEVNFGREVTAGLVRIFWERTNACTYALEYSDDGKSWKTAAAFEEPPKEKRQDIYLEVPQKVRYLRLHVTEVKKEEADLSLYYQNVSVLELEVYEGIADSFLVKKPEIPAGSRRKLVSAAEAAKEGEKDYGGAVFYPEVPEGYELTFFGADYEMLVDQDGRIADNIAGVWVELGFALEKDGVRCELPGMKVYVPPCAQKAEEDRAMQTAEESSLQKPDAPAAEKDGLPEGFAVMEWESGGGSCELTEKTRIVIPKALKEELLPVAGLFAEELSGALGRSVEVALAEEDGAADSDGNGTDDIYLCFRQDSDGQEEADWIDGLGEEGYEIDLGRACADGASGGGVQIEAATVQGLRWGCVTFLSLLEKSGGKLPEGRIRDYPCYSVRGFGIDVGRRPVSMELLYRIVEEMSKQKMNTLQIHLNDNQIISQSGYDGTLEGARSLYAGFRLESEVKNEAGEGITSSDLFYTKEEFAQFIADAAVYGVEVVPEIDTPAHSLALTKVFPALGLSGDPESADQLDLSKTEAVELGKALWSEYLTGEENGTAAQGEAVFADCSALHIGMDEYFGDEKAYISYLQEISAHVALLAPDKDIRIWGSLSKIKADHSGVSKNLQMHIWDTDWADPQEMYEEGFSIINSLSSSLYIIPGGGYDWLDREFLEEKWQPNLFETAERTWELPSCSPKMLGAVYMMWNDWAQQSGEDITEEDLFDRFADPLPVIAAKLWGSYENGVYAG